MSEERKKLQRNSAASKRGIFSLFDDPENPQIDQQDYDPRHPFIDRIIAIENKLDQLIRCYREADMSGGKTVVLDNADFIQLFKISGKTAQNWRDEGLIKYSQVKGKIFYRAEDVEKLLNRSRR